MKTLYTESKESLNFDRTILQLIIDNPENVELVKAKYMNDNFWKYAIDLDPTVFRFNKKPSEGVCYYAIRQDGTNLKYIAQNAKHMMSRQFCMKAFMSSPRAIIYFPEDYITDELLEEAASRDFSIVGHFDSDRFSKIFIIRKVKEVPSYAQYIKDPDEDVIYTAIDRDVNCAAYFAILPEKVKELVRKKYPEVVPLLPNMIEENSPLL